MFLLDTHVLSELRKIKAGRADEHVSLWAARTSIADYSLSVATIFEVERGILELKSRDSWQAAFPQRWLEDEVLLEFEDRIVPISLSVAQRCAYLHVPDPQPDIDSLLAATALVPDMTLVTRNVYHFRNSGVRLLNPWLPVSF